MRPVRTAHSLLFLKMTPQTPSPANPKPKKRFGADEDLLLLKQVNADRPFAAAHGRLLSEWDDVAAVLASIDAFRMGTVNGRACQARFKTLLEAHKSANRASARASGVDEDVTELTALLDDVLADFEDHVERADEAKRTKERVESDMESAGNVVRNAAVSRLRERDQELDSDEEYVSVLGALHGDSDRESQQSERAGATRRSKKQKVDSTNSLLLNAIKESNEHSKKMHSLLAADMTMRGKQFEAKMEARREEQKLEFEERKLAMRAESERLIMMMTLALKRDQLN